MLEFCAPIKTWGQWLRLTSITGITKFSQLSIFSELNNLRNISPEPVYAGICGITQAELDGQLAPDVAVLAEKLSVTPGQMAARLKAYYGGCHFASERARV